MNDLTLLNQPLDNAALSPDSTPAVRVLMIDDDRSAHLAVRAMLSCSRIDSTLEWCSSYQEGFDVLTANRHDVCLLDYFLGSARGVDLFLAARDAGSTVPTIMLTAGTQDGIDEEAMIAGFEDFLVKGEFNAVVLERSIRYAMERRRVADALRQREEYFRLLIENVSDIIVVLENSGTIRYVSPSVTQVLGYQPEEIVGTDANRFIHEEDRQKLLTSFRDLRRESGTVRSVVFRFRHQDGSWRYLESSGRNLLDQPLVQGLVVSSRDITRRIESQVALRESEQRFHSFMDNNPALAFIKDAEGRYLYVNEPFVQAAGLNREQIIGMYDYEVWSPETAAKFRENAELVLQSGNPMNFIETRSTPTGIISSYVIRFPLKDAEGRPLVAGIAVDATERIRAEAALKEAKERLESRVHERTAELSSAMQQLEESHRAQKRFVADASHDLRTPLTVIRGEVDLLLRRGEIAPGTRQSLTRVSAEIRRLENLANNLLTLATLDSDPLERHDLVRLDELLLDCVQKHTTLARRKSIRWGVQLGDTVELRCDMLSIERAIDNVLENAVKYSPEESLVEVVLAVEHKQAVIMVTDNGPGIPPEDLPHVFDRFYRSDQTRNTPGTGLGLSIVKSVVEAHNGRVSICSQPNDGTTVRLTLGLPEEISSEESCTLRSL